MNASLFYRRRAERFAQFIDDAGTDSPHRRADNTEEDLTTLVSLTRRISDLPVAVKSPPEFRDGLRAVLMATIEREGIGATAKSDTSTDDSKRFEARVAAEERRRARQRTRAFGAMVAGLAAAALALSGVSVASGDALPGDALYGFKRQTERAQLALTGSDTSKGQLYLDFARTRLDEARAVADDSPAFASILDDMDAETREGVGLLATTAIERRDAAALDVIDGFVTDQRRALTRLDLSGKSRDRAAESAALVERVATRSAALRTLVPCGSGAVGDRDELGPTPRLRCEAGQQGGGSPGHSLSASQPGGQRSSAPASTPASTTSPRSTASVSGGTAQPSISPTAVDGANLNGDLGDILGD